MLIHAAQSRIAIYSQDNDEKELLIPLNMGKEDLDVKKAWGLFGADVKTVGLRSEGVRV
jgi:hypothetical protein